VSEQTSEQADERADKQASGEQAAGERLASMQVERCVSSAHAKAPQRQVRERQCGRRRRGRPRSGAGGGCGGEEDDGEDTQQRWAWRRHQGWPVQWQGERTRALANWDECSCRRRSRIYMMFDYSTLHSCRLQVSPPFFCTDFRSQKRGLLTSSRNPRVLL
jgi:hypothetical protein